MRWRRLILTVCVFLLIASVPVTGTTGGVEVGERSSEISLAELKRLVPPRARPRPMEDRGGSPRGRGSPAPSGERRTIGNRIVVRRNVPPAKNANRLNWHGFPAKPIAAVGRLWIAIGGSPELKPFCTGTVVSTRLVVTAAHCLIDEATTGGGGVHPYVTRVVFVPGQTWNSLKSAAVDDIKAPYGVWEAVAWWVPASYKRAKSVLDWGLIQIGERSDGTPIAEVTGSFPTQSGIRFTGGRRIYAVGYPAVGTWSRPKFGVGRGQYACDSTWAAGAWLHSGGGYELWIRCPMNGGASGGPWFVKRPNGSWVIGGVNNQCNDDDEADDWSSVAYCTPVSTELRSLIFDRRFNSFADAVQKLLKLPPRNLVATAAVKSQLREAHLRRTPIAVQKSVRGPLEGLTYYGAQGTTRYAIATFSRALGTQDQPDLFSKPEGRPWQDRGDTGGCISSTIIPAPLLRLWGFKPDPLNPPCFLP